METLAAPFVRPPRNRRFSREEYYCMAEMGWFTGKRVELLDGEIIEMSPQLSWHACAIMLASAIFHKSIPAGWCVRVQLPLELGESSEPEPDIAIVRGSAQDFARRHPTFAELIIKVSESSLLHDRMRKAAIYAQSGIPEYWIINLMDNIVEVYRDPAPVGGTFGYGYKTRKDFKPGKTLSPRFPPKLKIAATDLLPAR